MTDDRPDAKAPRPTRPSAVQRLKDVDEVELVIDQLVAGGDGLGRYEGIPLFVPRSAPGDRLRVRLTERKKDYGRGEIVEILQPGPGRREPPCPYFARCGGCDLQHLEDDLQSRLKTAALVETLKRLGGLDLPDSQSVRLITGSPWRYRLRTQLHTEVDEDSGRITVGYHARGSHTLVPVVRCPILVPDLDEALADLPERLFGLEKTPRRLDLAAGDEGFTTAPVVEGLPHGEVSLTVGDFTYRYDARCFFQGHRSLLHRLVEVAVGEWEGELALDLYAGAGLFSLPLSRRYKTVRAVEGDRQAVRYARTNARRNRLNNLETASQAVESWLRQAPERANRSPVDRVLVDPPRSGLAWPVRTFLLEERPARLTYVSCHPATLARDLKSLAPRFQVESITALDLFPQTGHLEAVVQLVAKQRSDPKPPREIDDGAEPLPTMPSKTPDWARKEPAGD